MQILKKIILENDHGCNNIFTTSFIDDTGELIIDRMNAKNYARATMMSATLLYVILEETGMEEEQFLELLKEALCAIREGSDIPLLAGGEEDL